MSPEEARRELENIINIQNYEHDTEQHHMDADDTLCELLSYLGYDDIVNLYQQVDKWFA